jgi:hypothetical protein
MHNKTTLEESPRCACYHCIKIFEPKEIKEWTDNNDTAVCPFCNIDAVLPELVGFPFSEDLLHKIHDFWL